MEFRLASRLARNLQPPVPRSMHVQARRPRGTACGRRRGNVGLPSYICPACKTRAGDVMVRRSFSDTAFRGQQQQKQHGSGSFFARSRAALRDTKVQWRPIPVGLGIGFLGLLQMYRVNQREKRRREKEEEYETESTAASSTEGGKRPRKRKRIRPDGPWTVKIMSMLPLKAVSRLWGRMNEIQIPYYLRVPGFRLYAWIFGVNLSEVSEPDLHSFPNLASFFYRTLKPGVRPLATDPNALLSPADGRVLQFGVIEHGEVEQVKGVTYSLEALLGSASPTFTGPPDEGDISTSDEDVAASRTSDESIRADEEFATMSGVSYKLPQPSPSTTRERRTGRAKPERPVMDASTHAKSASIAAVRADLALGDVKQSWFRPAAVKPATALFYVVVYLAPGDYHRIHSPTAWVVERRRHFAGELYSVSPYLQRTLPGLFTLNERVALLGRWRHGFFSCTPVGATNVGSITVNFDRELRTNSLTTDTAADRAAERAAERGEPYRGFSEATYGRASPVLGGHALRRGEEMGGFRLGSTIVLVFEAPRGERKSFDEGWSAEKYRGGWRWAIEKGQKVKYGEALGYVAEA